MAAINREPGEYHKDNFTISTDPTRLDIDVLQGFLSTTYWARGIPKDVMRTAVENSLCFGLYDGNTQIGFARVVTDYVNHAYLGDVFVLEAYRGQGLAKWLIGCIVDYPDLQGIKRMMLITDDAAGLYSQFGFAELSTPEKFMERVYHRPWFIAEESEASK